MLKLRADSASPRSEFIFKPCLQSGTSPSELKKEHAVPVHKKDNKQSLKIYRPYHYSLVMGKYCND